MWKEISIDYFSIFLDRPTSSISIFTVLNISATATVSIQNVIENDHPKSKVEK
jgi:hypothetical protein